MIREQGKKPEQKDPLAQTLRRYLLLQQERLSTYLRILDNQKNEIEQGEIERLSLYVDLEQEVVKSIVSVQKVILPFMVLYRDLEPVTDIDNLNLSLEVLKREVLERNEKNRILLSSKLQEIKKELHIFKNTSRPFAGLFNKEPSTLVDITA